MSTSGPTSPAAQGTQLVVVDEAGVCGYLLSTDDTDAHHDLGGGALVAGAPRRATPIRRRTRATPGWCARSTSRRGPPRTLVAAYPAHLHIDLLARARGVGLGRVLIERLLGDLRARGVPAVHLGADPANENAIQFYEHLGFTMLALTADDAIMGLRLDR